MKFGKNINTVKHTRTFKLVSAAGIIKCVPSYPIRPNLHFAFAFDKFVFSLFFSNF